MIDWSSAEAQAALALAQKQRPRNVADFQAVELMLNRHETLWYTMLVNWTTVPPLAIAEASRPGFQEAAKLLRQAVDNGWLITGEPNEQMATMLKLMDFGEMIHALRDRKNYLVPASLDVIFDLVLGRGWERRFEAAKRHLSNYAKRNQI